MNAAETAMYDYWAKWFAQPLETKMRHLRTPGKGGYYPAGSEGPGLAGGRDEWKEYAHVRIGGLGWDNQTTREVFYECHLKAITWLGRHGLGHLVPLPGANHVLRILHYLPSPDGCVGEAHRDFDLLTVSVEGTAPGLEVWDEEAKSDSDGWLPGWVPQETGIQIGEMLEIYAPHHYPHAWEILPAATTHRVRTAPNTERYKAVFFYLPPNDFELRPGFTAGDYLQDVLGRAGTYGIGAKR